jgi:hypothetical protein
MAQVPNYGTDYLGPLLGLGRVWAQVLSLGSLSCGPTGRMDQLARTHCQDGSRWLASQVMPHPPSVTYVWTPNVSFAYLLTTLRACQCDPPPPIIRVARTSQQNERSSALLKSHPDTPPSFHQAALDFEPSLLNRHGRTKREKWSRTGTTTLPALRPRARSKKLHRAVLKIVVASSWVEFLELLAMDTSSPQIRLLPWPACYVGDQRRYVTSMSSLNTTIGLGRFDWG